SQTLTGVLGPCHGVRGVSLDRIFIRSPGEGRKALTTLSTKGYLLKIRPSRRLLSLFGASVATLVVYFIMASMDSLKRPTFNLNSHPVVHAKLNSTLYFLSFTTSFFDSPRSASNFLILFTCSQVTFCQLFFSFSNSSLYGSRPYHHSRTEVQFSPSKHCLNAEQHPCWTHERGGDPHNRLSKLHTSIAYRLPRLSENRETRPKDLLYRE
nr:hypothetical protein [Tanacetum cinerariifolium]